MMNKIKLIVILFFIIFLSSCSTVKEGFKNQKKNNTDEFLVQKKSPLVMPPNYKELPIPKISNNEFDKKENEIQTLINKEKKEDVDYVDLEGDFKKLEKNLIEKIRNKFSSQ